MAEYFALAIAGELASFDRVSPPETAIETGALDGQAKKPKVRQVDIDRGLRMHCEVAGPRLHPVRALALDHLHPANERNSRMGKWITLAHRANQQRTARIGIERGAVRGERGDQDQRCAIRQRREADTACQRPPGLRLTHSQRRVISLADQRFRLGDRLRCQFAQHGFNVLGHQRFLFPARLDNSTDAC